MDAPENLIHEPATNWTVHKCNFPVEQWTQKGPTPSSAATTIKPQQASRTAIYLSPSALGAMSILHRRHVGRPWHVGEELLSAYFNAGDTAEIYYAQYSSLSEAFIEEWRKFRDTETTTTSPSLHVETPSADELTDDLHNLLAVGRILHLVSLQVRPIDRTLGICDDPAWFLVKGNEYAKANTLNRLPSGAPFFSSISFH
ncbi:hypothetical protein C8R43DRAFT_196002 [Mycena crocata]|nr:hypothetical protein C8R43DRAFT_196002 [Mycena crocata]